MGSIPIARSTIRLGGIRGITVARSRLQTAQVLLKFPMMNCAINPYKSNKSGMTRHEIGGVIGFSHKARRSRESRRVGNPALHHQGKWHRPG
ncbi:MAG TPA: hypothetical protein VMJ12_15760 [Candidatus Acidoferrales bacterium]|nr:hypothetical protein [Candidatus Acidoferrales bacterium]